MKGRIKIPTPMLAAIREDLMRPHPFAYERVGFLTAGACVFEGHGLLLVARSYRPVDEEDYIDDPNPMVGVTIGSGAMRKALQSAYRPHASAQTRRAGPG